MLVDYIKHRGKFSVVGACEGAITGLVGITPAAGFVSVWLAALIGFLTSIVCALRDLCFAVYSGVGWRDRGYWGY